MASENNELNRLSQLTEGTYPFSAWPSRGFFPVILSQQRSPTASCVYPAGFPNMGFLNGAPSMSHPHQFSPYQSILFAPTISQAFPDVVVRNIPPVEEGTRDLRPAEPDVVISLNPEPTYQNDREQEEATYINNGEALEEETPPTYANEPEEQATYMNEEAVAEIKKEFFNNKPYKMLPLRRSASAVGPVPPPRSRRGSLRSSLASSTVSLNMFGSCVSLKDCHPVHIGKDPPTRPQRRKDRLRRPGKHLTTLPRNFKSSNPQELGLIPEYDVPSSENAESRIKTEVIEEEDEEIEEISMPDENATPKVPMPGTEESSNIPIPTVPMPGTENLIKSRKLTENCLNDHTPSVPMPGTKNFSDVEVPKVPMPGTEILVNAESLSVPMPGTEALFPSQMLKVLESKKESTSNSIDPKILDLESKEFKENENLITGSITDEINRSLSVESTSLQDPISSKDPKESSSSSFPEESDKSFHSLEENKNDETNTDTKNYEPNAETSDSDVFIDARSLSRSSSSDSKAELSISETGQELLKDIRQMDNTIQCMTLEMTKLIKVYDVVSQPERETVVLEEPIKIEIVDTSTKRDDKTEKEAVETAYELVDGRTREQINKAFRAAFFGIEGEEDGSNNDYEYLYTDQTSSSDKDNDYDDIVGNSPSSNPETDEDDLTEVVEVSNTKKKCDMSEAGAESNSEDEEDTLHEGGADFDDGSFSHELHEKTREERYDELVYKAMKFNWDESDGEAGLPPPLLLQEQIRTFKLDLLSSIFQKLYPTEEDCDSINNFISCPASLEEKYSMMRLSDILKKNKKMGVELDTLAEAMSQLARIGQELMKPEEERDPSWKSIPVAKEITVSKGIASRAPWEKIQGGTEILESLGYTEYTGFSMQYPRTVIPDLFADHIGNLTVELVLASVEISTLIVRTSPTIETLQLLQEAIPFPGNDPDYDISYPEVSLSENGRFSLPPRPLSALVLMETPFQIDNDDNMSVKSLPIMHEDPLLQDDYSFNYYKSVYTEDMEDENYYSNIQTSYPSPATPSLRRQDASNRRSVMMAQEGDYEEIGPGSGLIQAKASFRIQTCDLCGTNSATIRCSYCGDQVFCLACDDMYHKHPKRSSHSRKALSQAPRKSGAPKGTSPIAPPRRNSRKGSFSDVSFRSNTLSRTGTLSRNGGPSITGRPLPLPPKYNEREYNNAPIPPPPLPPPSSKTLSRKSSLAASINSPPLIPPPITAAKPLSTPSTTVSSVAGFGPVHQQIPPLAPRPPFQGHQVPLPRSNNGYPFIREDRSNIHNNHPPQNDANGRRYLQQMDMELWNERGMSSNPHRPPAYAEEVNFNPSRVVHQQPSNHQNSATQRRRRFNSQKLNKSSSYHDIAHAETGMNEGITWEDQWNPAHHQQTPFHAPFSASNFKRTLSSKSLHGDNNPVWENDLVPNGSFLPHPLFNPLGGGMGYNNPASGSIHRSMHELHNLGAAFNPYIYDPRLVPPQPRAASPVTSISSSHKSKKSVDRRSNKSGRKRSSPGRRSSHRRRSRSQSSRRGNKRASSSSSSSSMSEEDRTEDFFTGESDNDFVSLSSGSTSRHGRTPKNNWVCEHCTYVNTPGVTVCVVCCRTSKSSRGEEEAFDKFSKKKSGSKRNGRIETSEDDEDSTRKSGMKKRDNLSGKGRSDVKKSPMTKNWSSNNISDLEEDAVAAYYAVRRKGGKMESECEGFYESNSSESASAHNPHKTPNFDAPAPTKGILKKSSSNPQLSKIRSYEDNDDERRSTMTSKTDIGRVTQKLNKQLGAVPPAKVIDINKYLAQTEANPNIHKDRDFNGSSGDIWAQERKDWVQKQERLSSRSHENEYISDAASTTTTNLSRIYRSISDGQNGYEHGEGDTSGRKDENRPPIQQSMRKTSDVSVGRKNFRSKRFSRNSDKDSLIVKNNRFPPLSHEIPENEASEEWNQGNSRKNGGGSSEEEDLHFTATIEQPEQAEPPGGIGSYLSRKEFGSNEGNAMPDSGYVSHSSGGGSYSKLQLPTQAPIESFTMSVDRGFLGKSPPDRDMYLSMDDLSSQKTKGLELVRLLRDAEQAGYTAEDIQVALNHCGDNNPVLWLKDNWDNMNDTVVTLASNVGFEAKENTIGTLSRIEAKDALRKHKGNIWAAVTECVEQRQLKYDDLSSKGNFTREDIVTMLTAHRGNVEAAYQELNKAQLKPFLMRIWGQGESSEVSSGNPSKITDVKPDAAPDAVETEFHVKSKQSATPVEKSPKTLEFERRARKLLAEEIVPSYEKAGIVLKLREEFEELSEEEAVEAALLGDTLESARGNIKKECELCANHVILKEILTMASDCGHKCCKECAKNYFTLLIRDQGITEAVCPFCKEPSGVLTDEDQDDEASNYFAKLDILLKSIVDEDIHDLFQRKLRDRTLMKDPNFKWCYKCSSGFIAAPHTKKLICPDCKAMSCALCHVPWEPQHERISCEDFAKWKLDNDPESQEKGLEEHLKEYGITCPSCKFRYTLTKGGCMHFVCTQCKFEFCIGCHKPFNMGVKCGKGPTCARMGLHAHHPRNCLFYLRDKEPKDLQKLLKENKIEYKTAAPESAAEDKGCRIPMQRERDDGTMEDGPCGEPYIEGHAGYCIQHYVEYLGQLIFENDLDPVTIMVQEDLEAAVQRAGKRLPTKYGLTTEAWVERIRNMIKHEIPLETV